MPYYSHIAAQVAAAAVPVDLGKRQRRKVVYNEVELGRAKASDGSSSSSSGSEFEAEEAADDEDEDASGDGSGAGEEGADGKRVGMLLSNMFLWFLSSICGCSRLQASGQQSPEPHRSCPEVTTHVSNCNRDIQWSCLNKVAVDDLQEQAASYNGSTRLHCQFWESAFAIVQHESACYHCVVHLLAPLS